MVRSIHAFTIDHNQSGDSSPALAGTLIESLGIIPQRSSFSPSLYHTLGLPNLKSGGTMVPTAFTRRSVQLRSLGNLKYQPQCRSFQSNISTCICILDASHTKFFFKKFFLESVGIRNSIFNNTIASLSFESSGLQFGTPFWNVCSFYQAIALHKKILR